MQTDLFEPIDSTPVPTAGRRHFWRCLDCLSVMATDGEKADFQHYDPGRGVVFSLKCGCNGRLDYMGEVHRDRLATESWACPCDARCTNAPGPKCECSCGGKNHGTGIVVRVLKDAGGVPRITPPNAARAALIATAFRMAKAEARERIGWAFTAMARKDRGEWVANYSEASRAIRGLTAAAGILNHKQRLQALERIGR